MSNRSKRIRIALCALFCGSAVTGWASVSPCGGSPISTIIAAAGNVPSGGCGQYDLGFSGFFVGNSGNGNLTPPDSTMVNIQESGGTAGSTTTMSPIDLTFSSSAWSINTDTTAGNIQEGYVGFLAAPVPGQNDPSDGGVWGINGVALTSILGASITGAGIPSGDQIQIRLNICVGVSSDAACNVGNQAYLFAQGVYDGSGISFGPIQANCQSIVNCTIDNNQLNFLIPYAEVYIDGGAIALVANADTAADSSYNLSLGSFNAEFDQVDIGSAPEPGTFVLAAVGLGLVLKFRRR